MSKLIILICYFAVFSVWSNPVQVEAFFDLVKYQNFEKAERVAGNIEDRKLKKSLLELNELLKNRTNSAIILIDEEDSDPIRFVKLLGQGYQNANASNQNSLSAYKKFSEALKLAESLQKPYLIKAALIAILDLLGSEIFIGSKQYEPFLDQFIKLKSGDIDEALSIFYNLVFFTKADDNVNEVDTQYYKYMDKLDSIFNKIPKSNPIFYRFYYEKGMYYKIEEEFEKSEDFFLKADSLVALNSPPGNMRAVIAWQIAALNFQNNQLDKAKNYLSVSNRLAQKLKDTFYNNRLTSLIFQKEGNYDSAYHYLRKSVDIEYQLGYKNNTLESSILAVQNQTDKLKLDKLELDAQNKKITNWAIALGLVMVLGSVIAFLAHNNTKRKQLLAEQNKTLQEQRVATLLKEQELTTIDAIIEGQEKERQRIANDLHDDLGGLMANVKLHFNSLQEKTKNDKEGLFGKTNKLLDEAYNKIRAIAHAKNSGVIAKQGLLKAVEQMAEKVSAANRISIKVKDFGLDNRLENSMELALFRIIQELITNIIKHAEATNATIHLTNHRDTLNIMVEDNGIGFNGQRTAWSEKGMGLKSIDKRIAHLEGTFHIESEPGKGSTIIIDIPL